MPEATAALHIDGLCAATFAAAIWSLQLYTGHCTHTFLILFSYENLFKRVFTNSFPGYAQSVECSQATEGSECIGGVSGTAGASRLSDVFPARSASSSSTVGAERKNEVAWLKSRANWFSVR